MGTGDTPRLPTSASRSPDISEVEEDIVSVEEDTSTDEVEAPAFDTKPAPTPEPEPVPTPEPTPAQAEPAEEDYPELPEFDDSEGGFVFPDIKD